jgi:hypothetical protein
MAMKKMTDTARIIRATLRYVMVVHATWTPDLRFTEDTWDRKTSLNLCKYAVKINVSTSKTEEKTGNQFEALPKCRKHSPRPAGFSRESPRSKVLAGV